MIAMSVTDYPSVDAVAVTVVVVVALALAFGGAVSAWAAGRPGPVTPRSSGEAPGFDWPCACGHTSDKCTKKGDGSCDG